MVMVRKVAWELPGTKKTTSLSSDGVVLALEDSLTLPVREREDDGLRRSMCVYVLRK